MLAIGNANKRYVYPEKTKLAQDLRRLLWCRRILHYRGLTSDGTKLKLMTMHSTKGVVN